MISCLNKVFFFFLLNVDEYSFVVLVPHSGLIKQCITTGAREEKCEMVRRLLSYPTLFYLGRCSGLLEEDWVTILKIYIIV